MQFEAAINRPANRNPQVATVAEGPQNLQKKLILHIDGFATFGTYFGLPTLEKGIV